MKLLLLLTYLFLLHSPLSANQTPLEGLVLLTPDSEWGEKWASNTKNPTFQIASSLPREKEAFILLFFANASADPQGNAHLACDIKITKPDGTHFLHQDNILCYQGPLQGKPNHLRLGSPAIGFRGKAEDPLGQWNIEIVLKDVIAKSSLPLKTSFLLQ